MSAERKGYIVLYQGKDDGRSTVTILSETTKFYTVRHDVDWADRKVGDIRRIDKRYVRVIRD